MDLACWLAFCINLMISPNSVFFARVFSWPDAPDFGDVVFSVGWSQPPVSNQTFDREPCFMTKNPQPKKHLNREKRPKRYVYSASGDFGAVLRRGFKRHPLHDYCVFFSFWPGISHRDSPILREGSGSREFLIPNL